MIIDQLFFRPYVLKFLNFEIQACTNNCLTAHFHLKCTFLNFVFLEAAVLNKEDVTEHVKMVSTLQFLFLLLRKFDSQTFNIAGLL